MASTYRADFSAYGCEVDGCGYASLSLCQDQLTEQIELFELSTGLKVSQAQCAKRTRAERFYPVIEGQGEPEKRMQVVNTHSWRELSYIQLLAQGVQRVIEGESGRTAAYFIDQVKFSPSGSAMLRVFYYGDSAGAAIRFSEVTVELTLHECQAQKKYLEKATFYSEWTPSASVFCHQKDDSNPTTLLITSQKLGSHGDLIFEKANLFSEFSKCIEGREDILKSFPESGVAVVCKETAEREVTAYVLLRSKSQKKSPGQAGR